MKLFVPFVFITLQLCVPVSHSLIVVFNPSNVEIFVNDKIRVGVIFYGTGDDLEQVKASNWTINFEPSSNLKAEFKKSSIVFFKEICLGGVNIKGLALGFGTVSLARLDAETKTWIKFDSPLDVTVRRVDKFINKMFIAFFAIIVIISYVNMGCALVLDIIKDALKRPTGPAIGCFCQLVIMPLVSYGVGYLTFEDPVLRIALLTLCSTPPADTSNKWTVRLGGDYNLGVAMTFISSVVALGTIPFWLFTLGNTIITETKIIIPVQCIIASLCLLTVPIGICFLIQLKFPNTAVRFKKIFTSAYIILVICILVSSSIGNIAENIFKLLTWRTVFSASLSILIGVMVSILFAVIFGLSRADIITIVIKTGIQNYIIAFVLLSSCLKSPVSDIASPVPIAGSFLIPITLCIIYCYENIYNSRHRSEDFELEAIIVTQKNTVNEKEI